MKITFVTNLYGEYARGGAERIVAQEAEALAKLGHDVTVVSGERQRTIPKGVCLPGEPWLCPPTGTKEEIAAAYAAAARRETVAGAPRIIRYHPPNIYFYSDDHRHGFLARFIWHLRDIFNRKSARTLAEILRYEKPDVVHTHNLMGLGFMIPRVLRQSGVRHIHTVHDVQLLHPSGLIAASTPSTSPSKRGRAGLSSFASKSGRAGLSSFASKSGSAGPSPFTRGSGRGFAAYLYITIMRRLFGSPDVVLFPSKFLMDLHEKNGFFPNSKKVLLANPAPAVSLAAREMPRNLSFLFVGQLEKHKGVEFLLDVWESWDDRGDATLEIAGAGSLEAGVKDRLERLPGIRFVGKLDAQDVLNACSRAAFLIVPSLVIENAPTVILESFSRGTPVVAAASGGIPEFVVEGETGVLFTPGDKGSCLEALRRARGAMSQWQSYFERVNRKASAMTVESHIDKLRSAYEHQIV